MPDANDVAKLAGPEKLGEALNSGIENSPRKRRKKFSQHRPFGKVQSDLWIGQRIPKFQTVSAGAKLVYLYLLSSPHSNMLGLYHLRHSYIIEETGMEKQDVEDALKELEKAGMIQYDPEMKWIYVPDFVATQVLGDDEMLMASDKRAEGARRVLTSIPESKLRDRLLGEYGSKLHLSN